MNVVVAIPVNNEATIIEQTLQNLMDTLPALLFPHGWSVVVAENGSTDATADIVEAMLGRYPALRLIRTGPGKGAAIVAAWSSFDADAYVFMDADLSADLRDLPTLIAALEQADIAAASRLHRDSQVKRTWPRTLQSRVYNLMARLIIGSPVSDLQCGFKAVRRRVVSDIVPKLESTGFFFDTELIALSRANGLTVAEVPISWVEFRDPRRGSKVRTCRTSAHMFRDLIKLRQRLRKNPVV